MKQFQLQVLQKFKCGSSIHNSPFQSVVLLTYLHWWSRDYGRGKFVICCRSGRELFIVSKFYMLWYKHWTVPLQPESTTDDIKNRPGWTQWNLKQRQQPQSADSDLCSALLSQEHSLGCHHVVASRWRIWLRCRKRSWVLYWATSLKDPSSLLLV